MNRVATIPLQRTMAEAIQRSQRNLAVTQTSLSTGKKAQNYASLGTEAVRTISAHSLLSRQKAEALVSKHVSTTLAIYDAHVTRVDTVMSDLRTQLITAIGIENSDGLQETIRGAFDEFRSNLNAVEGGSALFAGSRSEELPFVPKTLEDTLLTAPGDAFLNDNIRPAAYLSEGREVTYGITASDVGEGLYEAFRTLAGSGIIGAKLTEAQKLSMREAIAHIDKGLGGLRSVNAENGRRQNRVETLGERAEQRSLLLKGIIASNEDADLGQVAVDLAQQTATLEASYSVFAQIAGMNLTKYL